MGALALDIQTCSKAELALLEQVLAGNTLA